VLKQAVDRAKLGQDEKLGAIRRLDEQARRLEAAVPFTPADLARGVAAERRAKAQLGGRTVGDDRRARQLALPFDAKHAGGRGRSRRPAPIGGS
jgi:hypothetical protein